MKEKRKDKEKSRKRCNSSVFGILAEKEGFEIYELDKIW